MDTQLTDIHIRAHSGPDDRMVVDLEGSLLYAKDNDRGPITPVEEQRKLLQQLLEACLIHKRPDFLVEVSKSFYRCRRDDHAVDGTWFRLRRMADEAPTLETLPQRLPVPIMQALLNPQLARGGLILVTGGPGCGKTHTGSATVVSRLLAHGGVGFTIEDPPELPLNGRHGKGYCTQTHVPGDTGSDWVEAMRGVLRSQPVGQHLMMFVGEIRDAQAARVMLRAASNGFLVIATSFGTNIISSIDGLFQLVGQEYSTALAQLLRVVVFQTIRDKRLSAEMLTSEGPGSRVAAIIKSGHLAQLTDEIQSQRNAQVADFAQQRNGLGRMAA